MTVPYFLMAFLYLALAGLAVLDTALVNFQLLPALPNLRWLIIHLVVLGALTEFVFGGLPWLAAVRLRRKPQFRWDTWLLLNAGFVVLLIGIVVMNFLLITTGGTLIFLAVLWLGWQLLQLRPVDDRFFKRSPLDPKHTLLHSSGLKFYLAGLGYLLTGILVGTGLWQGWSGPLRIAIPKEVHVHANLWGFTALVLAGLLIDLAPAITRIRSFPQRYGVAIFWLMNLGALGLVLGPWLNINTLQVVGLVLHTAGSILLMLGIFRPIRKNWRTWSPGVWHLLGSYVWFFLPVVVAPLVVMQMGAGNEVAGSGGPILIFGWILQILYGLFPYVLRKVSQVQAPNRLGGTWFSLATSNAGSLLYWISLFFLDAKAPLRGTAYLLWLVSLLPMLVEIVSILKTMQAPAQPEWVEPELEAGSPPEKPVGERARVELSQGSNRLGS